MIKDRLAAFPYWPHLISLGLLLLAFAGYRFFAYHYTRSNDSYVSANIVNMATLVSGPISRIYVADNQAVQAGDKLIEIDPRPYQYAMDKAFADYKMAKLRYETDKLSIQVAKDKLAEAKSVLALSLDHYQRYLKLIQKGAIPEIQLINIESKVKDQEAMVQSAEQQLKIAVNNLDVNIVLAAKAKYEQARYDFNQTTLVTPTKGFITNFNLRIGQYVTKGEGLFALVETARWWVVTRYRETAIRLIKPGDKAKITIDMYPGKVFHGHVHSIGWGINRVQSGMVAPSTLTYLEATEDWIKIAQRFPVRIYIDDIDPDYPLRIGASAVTTTYSQR